MLARDEMAKIKGARFSKLGLGDERRLTAGASHHRAPAWSRDGRHLIFAVGRVEDSTWCVVDRRGRVVRTLEGPAAGSASFGPRGEIAFERRFGASREIWLTPGGDAPSVRLLGGDGRLYRDPCLSPDGATLACATADDAGGGMHLLLVSIDSGRAIALSSTPDRSDTRPRYTPDGEELIFEGRRGDDHAIYALHLRRNTLERLTPETERAGHPTPVGDRVVVYQREDQAGGTRLVLLDREAGRAQDVVDDVLLRGEPDCHLGKAGKARIAYARYGAEPDASGEPPRLDIYTARLRGVAARVEEPAPPVEVGLPPEARPSPAAARHAEQAR